MSTCKFTSLTLVLAACASSQAFIANGSFETGLAYPGGPNIFSAGTPAPWVATTFTPDMYDNTGADGWGLAGIPAYQNMFAGVAACKGNRFIGFGASVTFSFQEAFGQSVSGLTVNQSYTISSCMITDTHASIPQYGGPYSGFGQVDAYFNNVLIGTFSPNTTALTWQARSFSFVAPASSGFLEFRAAINPFDPVLQGSYMGLDDIQVVPEPGSVAALAIGAAAVIVRRRRAVRT